MVVDWWCYVQVDRCLSCWEAALLVKVLTWWFVKNLESRVSGSLPLVQMVLLNNTPPSRLALFFTTIGIT